ncbi:MAG: NAD(P)-dependent oxidoreductase [Rhodospirillaceae bacterium]|nr:NAD(P)-dependent oxidoreductase [Rhodospirillaceae bacterium]MBT4464424.1 NAD(P)-dependent oxidoreductase [Rhodospirillaceae bacterium]MBT5309505.1 NAD(P)-dependent oxidoreductase [Rhodospirillaceae bacterium]MBT7356843.1 NAD(P)-dependent oxidoreductase [Rhodospirillaceae bacterium]
MSEFYAGKTVFVTGASGYVGSALVSALNELPCRVVCHSRKPTKGDGWIDGDIAEAEFWVSCLETYHPDIIFHLAAQTSLAVAEKTPDVDFRGNVQPIKSLIDACIALKARPCIVSAGTVTETGVTTQTPVAESNLDNPVTVFDQHKLMAEQILIQAAKDDFVQGTCLRLANVYGPGVGVGASERGVLMRVIGMALKGDGVRVYGDGKPVRDYVYIDDVVAAFLAAGASLETTNGKYFVIGTGRGWSLQEAFTLVADKAGEATGNPVDIENVEWPSEPSPIEFRNFAADSSAFHITTGWQAETGFEAGVDKSIAFILASEK